MRAPRALAALAASAGVLGVVSSVSAARRHGRSSYEVRDVTPVGARTAWALTTGNQLHDPPQAVVRSSDGGRTWEHLSSDANLTRFGVLWFTTPSVGWDLDLTGGRVVLHTTDGGRHWNALTVPER